MTQGRSDMPERADRLRLLMIGPTPPPVGGTTVSFEALCRFLAPRTCSCIIIDTVRRRGGTALTGLATLWQLIRNLRRTDIITAHFSDRAAVTIAPILWLTSRIAGKPFVFRQFGGEFDRTFVGLPRWWRWIILKTILRSDAVFLQTHAMMRAFAPFSSTLHWFPTARYNIGPSYKGRFARGDTENIRCLFLGHVSRAKGVVIAAEAITAVPSATLDVYGPLIDLGETEFAGDRIRYRGIAAPETVSDILAQYDVLLFPTTHPGEGYSGTLVEAAMAGLPMIVTRWQSLPEMFSEDEAIFIDPGSTDQLIGALRALVKAPDVLLARSQRLIRRAADFDADRIFGHFLAACSDIVRSYKA